MPICSVQNCGAEAAYEVILYDVYPGDGLVFFEQDHTCPFICAHHIIENEEQAKGERRPRGFVTYPYSNRNGAQGFSIYKPL